MHYVKIPYEMPFGSERRAHIKAQFLGNENARLYVNSDHQIQVKNDPDLKKLIKSGFLLQEKERPWFTAHHNTYLVHNHDS